jgi:PAS domain S-box-containing protein
VKGRPGCPARELHPDGVPILKPPDDPSDVRLLGSDRSYRELYENMPVMYFEMDAEGTVLSVNAFGAWQLGYEPAELLGRPVTDVFHEDDRDAVARQLKSLIETGGVESWEFRKRRKDGSVLWVRETARPIRTATGEVEVMVVCQDITDRKRAEEERERAEHLVRELSLQLGEAQERERRRIAVHLHDDVGQTLAAIHLRLARLEAGGDPDDLREVQELLQRAIGGTRSLAYELASPVLYELGLAEALRSLCERQGQEGDTLFRFECPDEGAAVPERVAVSLYRIASELVFNVRKHARARHARVALLWRRGRIELVVEDDGRGFDPEAALDGAAAGTHLGLGLFSIRQRADLLGGRLEIRSAPGRGTRVRVDVPLARKRRGG